MAKSTTAKRNVTVVMLYDPEEEVYLARVPGFPGVITSGGTVQEALANAKEALEGYLEGADEDPDDVGDSGIIAFGRIEVEVPVAEKSRSR